ncbi:MAG: mechanosensitive ion channel family protein [Oscillospiraceae bacterium]|nr:mechanosensitive ion channel family protein [Oscillospiraceae bacterium]
MELSFFIQLGVAVLCFILFSAIGQLLKRKIFVKLIDRFQDEKHYAQRITLIGFQKPVALLCSVIGLYLSVVLLPFPDFVKWATPIAGRILRVSVIICATWGALGSSEVVTVLFRGMSNKLDMEMDRTLTRFLSRVLNVIIVCLAAVILLSEFHYDINGLIAGIGLSGLTIALAAQDSASNFFGGLVIILERPFSIGDWITCGTLEGVVEDISFRSTRIRMFSDTLIVVPNSKLAAEPITNWTKMRKRQVKFSLTVTYNTPKDKLKLLTQRLQTLLTTHPHIVQEGIQVRLNEFSACSIDILIMYFTSPTDINAYNTVKEEINYGIIGIMEELGIDFAFPTQTVYLEK